MKKFINQQISPTKAKKTLCAHFLEALFSIFVLIFIHGVLVCIASFAIILFLCLLLPIISIVFSYLSFGHFLTWLLSSFGGFLWMESWIGFWAQMIVYTMSLKPFFESIMPPLKLLVNFKFINFVKSCCFYKWKLKQT